MDFIDTHTHLYVDQFDEDRSAVVQKAIDAGVSKMLLPNIDTASIESLHQLSKEFPKNCYPMMGLHPCSVTENWKEDLAIIKSWLDKGSYIGVGEIGIDLYWDKSTKSIQQEAFAQQIIWAKELKLPIAIHVRDAFNEAFEVVQTYNDDQLSGVFHCFTGNLEEANKVIGLGGFKLGLGGVLTFKNSGLDAIIKEVDLSHIILETDAPYLAPMPFRGKRNESAYVTYVASKLSEIKEISIEQVAAITTSNALALFAL